MHLYKDMGDMIYREFFHGNILGEIEFAFLTIFFVMLMYKNAHKINVFYASKFNKGIKFLIPKPSLF